MTIKARGAKSDSKTPYPVAQTSPIAELLFPSDRPNEIMSVLSVQVGTRPEETKKVENDLYSN